MNEKISYSQPFQEEQLHDHLKKVIEFHCQNYEMKFPIPFKFDDPEYKLFMNNKFEINSELDIEMIALMLSKFPYGDTNKYRIGDFYYESELIKLAASRYVKDKNYKSFKDFYERNPEACFDKTSSVPVWDETDENLSSHILSKREIFTKNDLIKFYGYPYPMNFLEQEFNHMIWDAFKSYDSFESFEAYVEEKKSFLRSYFDKTLKNQNGVQLVSLNEFIYSELSCSYY